MLFGARSSLVGVIRRSFPEAPTARRPSAGNFVRGPIAGDGEVLPRVLLALSEHSSLSLWTVSSQIPCGDQLFFFVAHRSWLGQARGAEDPVLQQSCENKVRGFS